MEVITLIQFALDQLPERYASALRSEAAAGVRRAQI